MLYVIVIISVLPLEGFANQNNNKWDLLPSQNNTTAMDSYDTSLTA